MNSNVMPSIVQMEEDVLRQLVTEVKETVATDFQTRETAKKPSFGILDLWNIQRKMKSAVLPFRRELL
ncbi:MAG: hypothetical protein ABUT20_45085 [Bacteroidota bacterium]